MDISQETNELKMQFADISHQTQELHKKDIAAAEAVSQVQARLAQQKDEIAASERKYTREVAMRHKWAREKAKFEKYYNDQVLAIEAKQSQHQQSQVNASFVNHVTSANEPVLKPPGNTTPIRRCRSRNGRENERTHAVQSLSKPVFYLERWVILCCRVTESAQAIRVLRALRGRRQ